MILRVADAPLRMTNSWVSYLLCASLKGAFDGAGATRVCGSLLRRGRYEAHDVQQAFGLERLRHADDCAELVAGGVVGRLSGSREKNDGNALEALIALDDEAEVLAGHVFGFDFGDEDGRDRGLQDFEGLIGAGDDDDGVAVGLKRGAHDLGSALIGFDSENDGLLGLCRRRRGSGRGSRTRGSGSGGDKLNGNGEAVAGLLCNADDLGGLRFVQCSGSGRVRECDVDRLANSVG